jgi:cytoskeletal protein RodZ
MDEENHTSTDDVSADEPVQDPERPEIADYIPTRTVGDMLAAERRRQGKSLGDIAEVTCIRLRMLEALENASWEQLPSPAYVKGYIQNYATALGLSAEPFLEAYRHDAPLYESQPEASAALGDPILPSADEAHAIPIRAIFGLVAVLALIGVVWLVLGLVSGPADEPAPLPPAIEDDVPSDDATTSVPGMTDAQLEETTPETASAETPAQPFVLGIAIQDDDASWIRVTVDGERVYEGTLDGGESRSWDVAEIASVRIGRPSVVSVTRDGEPVEIPSGAELPTIELSADD